MPLSKPSSFEALSNAKIGLSKASNATRTIPHVDFLRFHWLPVLRSLLSAACRGSAEEGRDDKKYPGRESGQAERRTRMSDSRKPTIKEARKKITALADRPVKLKEYLDSNLPFLVKPAIADFSPRMGYAGTMLEIRGNGFASARQDNEVSVGGNAAKVVQASPASLKVITDLAASTGPVEVKVGTHIAKGPEDFRIQRYPDPGLENDGPPIHFDGRGEGQTGDLPSTGTLRLLVVLVNPTDRVPANPTATRNTVIQAWNNARDFYNQASYGRLNVQVTVTNSWHTLTGNFNDYIDTSPSVDNIRPAVLNRLLAEAAQAAVNAGGQNYLDNFDVMACVINLDGTFIRAWGNMSNNNFSYNNGAGTNINITVNHTLYLVAIQESANWGRCAHELGHDIVSAPTNLQASPGAAVLGEDVYATGLIDTSTATARLFEMMGSHDTHPLFSAYYMEQLGYYGASNMLNLPWNRNQFSQEYEVVAHGLAENTYGGRYHLIKIRVADGLCYYVEVRQQPDGTTQIFDDSIPLDGAPQHGGVIVTKVLTDTVNMNQQLRFITLLHDPRVLKQGDVAVDPARALKITVVNDHTVNRPLVCRVRVEWAQGIADDPNGAFDLSIQHWDGNYQTPDIWVDRIPYGAYDQPLDPQSRPQGNGDRPRPLEINLLYARIHCSGTVGATDVRATFYAVEPPGVGDNGNWAPLQTKLISIPANGFTDFNVNWVPVVGQHTCLKVWAEQQLGESAVGNNWAQENIFQFEAPAHSIPEPVIMPVAVRNPLKQRTIVLMEIRGVPDGYTVHFPHSWLWLEPLEERRFELTIIPTRDYPWYRDRKLPYASVRLEGYIPRQYKEEIHPGVFHASRMFSIGGITAQVTPKRSVEVKLYEDKEDENETHVALKGVIAPAMKDEKLRVDLIDPNNRLRALETKTDTQGGFCVVFDLTTEPSVDAKPRSRTKEKPLPGIYKGQAFVVNSPNAAQAESNIIYVTR